MVNQKVTPAIERFIQSNCNLTPNALAGLVFKKFKIKISDEALRPWVEKARSEAAAENAAKIEAVRSKILDDADKWANKYLQYIDEEIESLRTLIDNSDVELETARDRIAASQALHRMLSTIVDFVKPEPSGNLEISLSWGDGNETKNSPSPPAEGNSQG